MFKNRSIQMKLVRDNAASTEENEIKIVDPEQIAQIATDYTMKTIATIGAVVAANRILKTICEIAVITAHAKNK